MALKTQDILSKRFAKADNGYDPNEVDIFIESIVNNFRQMNKTIKSSAFWEQSMLSLTPDIVRKKTFGFTKDGYDFAEVTGFLDEIANEFSTRIQRCLTQNQQLSTKPHAGRDGRSAMPKYCEDCGTLIASIYVVVTLDLRMDKSIQIVKIFLLMIYLICRPRNLHNS
ncbi:hypothetical protein AGMMS49992_31790 [Clostridia bacterium]|nr:hypothetical protein AGMMS49992_31790 [Clostridia bacterium]